jgi:LL-diaminopimelate aminotransferase
MRRDGVDVIDLGIGDPDLPSPPAVVEAMAREARDAATHRYPTNRGSEGFRAAAASFYEARFGVSLDPRTEIVPVLGGKEGVSHVCLACLEAGDVCLSPDPGYPPYTSGPLFAGAELHYLPLEAANGFLPDLEAVPAHVAERANLLFLNYPNNPTGAVADDELFERAVAFARRYELIVVHDSSYSELCFDGYRAPSFLATTGAKDVGVEIFSLSKGWNMTGWRTALMAGNADVVERYRHLKTNIDSGMFEALQRVTAVALEEARDFPREMSEVYRRRRDIVVEALRAIGVHVDPPQATPYVWAPVPERHTSASFAELVLEQSAVVLSPGPAFGPSGEGFFRVSLTVPDDRLEEAVRRIETALPARAG